MYPGRLLITKVIVYLCLRLIFNSIVEFKSSHDEATPDMDACGSFPKSIMCATDLKDGLSDECTPRTVFVLNSKSLPLIIKITLELLEI